MLPAPLQCIAYHRHTLLQFIGTVLDNRSAHKCLMGSVHASTSGNGVVLTLASVSSKLHLAVAETNTFSSSRSIMPEVPKQMLSALQSDSGLRCSET